MSNLPLPPTLPPERAQTDNDDKLVVQTFREALNDDRKVVEFKNVLSKMSVEGTLDLKKSTELSGDTLLHRAVRMGKLVSTLLSSVQRLKHLMLRI